MGLSLRSCLKSKKTLYRSQIGDKSDGVLLQNYLVAQLWEKTLPKVVSKVVLLDWSVVKKSKKHCARASHLIKVTECCSKTRLFTNNCIEGSVFRWEGHENIKKTLRRSITSDTSDGVLLQSKIVDQKLIPK